MQTEWHVPFNVCLSVSINYLVVDLDHYNNNSYDKTASNLPFSSYLVREVHARASVERDTRNEDGSPRRKKRDSLFSCLSRLAP